jgi:FkbM family methyltransferase
MRDLWEYLSTDKNIILYGTGDGADKVLSVMNKYGLEPKAFMASDDFVRGQVFRGYKVKKLEEIEESFKDFIILICFGTDREDVLANIIKLTEKYEVYAPDVPLIGEEIYNSEYIAAHAEEIVKARDLLADEKSAETFNGWLNYRLSGRIDILEDIAVSRKEALKLLDIKASEQGFYIDAGACRGDTVEEFIDLTGGYIPANLSRHNRNIPKRGFKKIIAIEPETKNFIRLKRKFFAYGSGIFVPVNAAAWSSDGRVILNVKTGRASTVNSVNSPQNETNTVSHEANTVPHEVDRKRNKQVETLSVSIDSLVYGETAPTYIKIDTEGAEAEVIKGARNVITKYKPKLTIALYHRAEDMYSLPLMLKSLNPEYKFYLRKTRCIPGWEFNLFAV